MHPRQRYKKNSTSHRDRHEDWGFWKVVFAGWLINSPRKFIQFFLGLLVVILCLGTEIFHEIRKDQKNYGGQNYHHRSY